MEGNPKFVSHIPGLRNSPSCSGLEMIVIELPRSRAGFSSLKSLGFSLESDSRRVGHSYTIWKEQITINKHENILEIHLYKCYVIMNGYHEV